MGLADIARHVIERSPNQENALYDVASNICQTWHVSRYCSPRHRMPLDRRNEDSKYVSTDLLPWPA
jgi:hypothetical protein